jgi:uncharacterized cupin superfamily protein
MNEARLQQTEHGLVPEGEGWFVLNTCEAPWYESAEMGRYVRWEGSDDARFQELGINLSVLQPGQPMCMYHGEDSQEDFLVISGHGVLVIEGVERELGPWDFVHCPNWVQHVIVASGAEPLIVLAVGARNGRNRVIYPVDETAQKHGAGVREETSEPREAYAGLSEIVPVRYAEGDLPGA